MMKMLIRCRSILILWLCALAVSAHGQSAGTALQFDGTNQFVDIPNFGTIAPTSEVTVEFWAYPTAVAQQSAFMLQPDQGANRFQSHILYNNGNTYWDFGNINTSGRLVTASPPGLLNAWTHYALVASATGNYMRIYTNGILMASRTGMTPFVQGTYDLQIGGNAGFYFHGIIDEFRVWKVARTQSQIQSAMNGPLLGDEANLLLYYRFDEGSGLVTANSATATGAAFNGTLNNGPAWVASGAGITSVPPVVVTGAASSITAVSASLSATINPEGGRTEYYFEYGNTTNYGSVSTTAIVPSNSGNFSISIDVNGLTPNTTYHYRIDATKGVGIISGNDATFTTPPAFNPVAPPGAGIYQVWVTNHVDSVNGASGYTAQFNSGVSLSVASSPSPDFWPATELFDPDDVPFAELFADAPGQASLLENASLLEGGGYSFSTSGLNGTTGTSVTRAVLNAGIEQESYLDAPNNSLLTAQDLAPMAVPVGVGQKMAVVGNLSGRPSLLWPDPADFYRFSAGNGDVVTILVASQNGGAVRATLENSSGAVLALGTPGNETGTQVIENFAAQNGGYFYVAVTGDSGTAYSLVVMVNASIVLENGPENPQGIAAPMTICGQVDPTLPNQNTDSYLIAAGAGDPLSFATRTPNPGPPEIASLNTELLLSDNHGNLVAIAEGNASDGHNSLIDFTVPTGGAGLWLVEVTSPDGSQGDYQLTVQGASGTYLPAMNVLTTTPSNNAAVGPPTTVTVTFTQPIYGPSLTPGEMTINHLSATSVVLTSANSATWTVPAGAIPLKGNLANVAQLDLDPTTGQPVTSLLGAAAADYAWQFNTGPSLASPFVGADQILMMENGSTNIPVSALLANDNSLNGPLSITNVSSASGASVALQSQNSIVAYSPPPGFSGIDSFSYIVTDTHRSATGMVSVVVIAAGAPPFNHLNMSGFPSDLQFSYSGIPGQQYELQSATSVTGPWYNIFPSFYANQQGIIQYRNATTAPPPSRFFRMLLVP
jgi:Concanavalin A-like lectin/glucanases superfamily/Bacterial Ig domain